MKSQWPKIRHWAPLGSVLAEAADAVEVGRTDDETLVSALDALEAAYEQELDAQGVPHSFESADRIVNAGNVVGERFKALGFDE